MSSNVAFIGGDEAQRNPRPSVMHLSRLDFDPTHSGGNDNAIETQTLGSRGGLDISGVPLQIAGSLYFF